MKVTLLNESSFKPALYGLGLSYGITSEVDPYGFMYDKTGKYGALTDRLIDIATKLAVKGDGHNEFLIHITTEWVIQAPRYWWEEMIQYRFADMFPTRMQVSDLSESTMHTLTARDLKQSDFEYPISPDNLAELNLYRQAVKDSKMPLERFKNHLPEGFLQKRVLGMNYLCLQNIVKQREKHRLPEWRTFCQSVSDSITFPEWVKI